MGEHLILESIEALAKDAYLICPEKSNKSNEPIGKLVSSFGGSPFFSNNEEWPKCKKCKNSLDLVLKLFLENEASVLKIKEKYLHLFYCWECLPNILCKDEKNEMTFFSTKKNPIIQEYLPVENPEENVTHFSIISFQKFRSFPSYFEIQDENHALHTMLVEQLKKIKKENSDYSFYTTEKFYEDIIEQIEPSAGFSFVGGYPQWLKKSKSPICMHCKLKMEFLLQIDSEEVAELNWGNNGCAYIFICPKKKSHYQMVIQN